MIYKNQIKMDKPLSGFEKCNQAKVKKLLKKISESIKHASYGTVVLTFCSFTVNLPLSPWTQDFQKVVESALIDSDIKFDLEDTGIINWCRSAKKLYPLTTKKDGNCLLHGICLYIWGISDIQLILRGLLYKVLATDRHDTFKNRYRYSLRHLIHLDKQEFEKEWKQVIDTSKPNDSSDQTHDYLEPIHIYVLANILQRPIIVYSDTRIRNPETFASLQDNEIGGIYLPLEVSPEKCTKDPILLAYHMNHFCPLVIYANDPNVPNLKGVALLQLRDLCPIPVRFLYPGEEHVISDLMDNYLTLETVCDKRGSYSSVKIGTTKIPQEYDLITDYFQDCERKFQKFPNYESKLVEPSQGPSHVHTKKSNNDNLHTTIVNKFENSPCRTAGCEMYGSPATGGYCSSCLFQYSKDHAGPPSTFYIVPTAPPPSFPIQESFKPDTFLEAKCQTSGCQFHCSSKTFPYCHECDEKKSNQSQKQKESPSGKGGTEDLRRISEELETPILVKPNSRSEFESGFQLESQVYKAPSLGLGVPGGSYEGILRRNICTTPSCNEQASQMFDGICPKCYAFLGENGTRQSDLNESWSHLNDLTVLPSKSEDINNISSLNHSRYEDEQPQNTSSHTSNSDNSSSNLGAPQTSPRLQKNICSTPGCEGMWRDNELDMCLSCYEKNKRTPVPSRGMALKETSGVPLPESIIESGGSNCCYGTGRENEGTYINCSNTLCNKKVYPPSKLCNSCVDVFRKNLPRSLSGATITTNSSPIRYNMYPIENTTVRSNTAPSEKRGKHCKVQSCTRFGDPATKDMCSRCFQIANPHLFGSVVQRSDEQGAIGNDDFIKNVKRIEEFRKGTKFCRMSACHNYANPHKEGFCNACFTKFRRDFPRHVLERPG